MMPGSATQSAATNLPDPNTEAITRLLYLHGRQAFALAWPHVQPAPLPDDPTPYHVHLLIAAMENRIPKTVALALTKDYTAEPDPLLTLAALPPPPPVRRLVLVRDDGFLTAPGATPIHLHALAPRHGRASTPPFPPHRLWSTPSLQAYCAGYRPAPAQVFAHLTAILDRFISLSPDPALQTLAVELLAVYVLATWLLPAFSVFAPLWITGPVASGKTRLLHLLARLVHLGLVVPRAAPAGSLLPLAALGAGLAVDDAAGLIPISRHPLQPLSPRTVRQAVFLAGDRRGVHFPLGSRALFHVPADGAQPVASDLFGPRLFAAAELPHPSLAAHSLVLLLPPQPDPVRALADPESIPAWPYPPAALVDDLWCLALAHLPRLPAYRDRPLPSPDPNASPPPDGPFPLPSPALGRPLNFFLFWFQPSPAQLPPGLHPLLAVAAWLTDHGLPGLAPRLAGFLAGAQAPLYRPVPGRHTADLTLRAVRAVYLLVGYQLIGLLARAHRLETAEPDDDDVDADDDSTWTSRKKSRRPAIDDDDELKTYLAYLNGEGTIRRFSPLARGLFDRAIFTFRPAQVADLMADEARLNHWHGLAERLTPNSVGHLLGRLRLARHRDTRGQTYTLTLAGLNHLIAAHHLGHPLPNVGSLFEVWQSLERVPDHSQRLALTRGAR